jgi:hypothetical protein
MDFGTTNGLRDLNGPLMQFNPHNPRLLALDLRARRFGFAVLGGPVELLDWGTRRWRAISSSKSSKTFIRKQAAVLLKRYDPSIIVMKEPPKRNEANSGQRVLTEAIIESVKPPTELAFLGREEIQKAFRAVARPSKYTIAAHVALVFPELTWKLPPVRKAWMNEAHTAIIFDAIALGLAYFTAARDISSESPFPSSTMPG